MDYPTFQRNGWPIGSGMVESGNKLVMQAWLKGAGMHWDPNNVNPMPPLRMNLCNGCWQEGWVDQQQWQRATQEQTQRSRQQTRLRVKEQHRRDLRTLVTPPVPSEVKVREPKPKTGRIEAQRRRVTSALFFSPASSKRDAKI